jgi:hypothetical protein
MIAGRLNKQTKWNCVMRLAKSTLRDARLCICPTCGQPRVPEGLASTPTQNRLLQAVRHHPGISSEELRGVVWAHDPNGGPENRKTLHVHVNLLNHRLRAHGLAVRGSCSSGYRIVAHGGGR